MTDGFDPDAARRVLRRAADLDSATESAVGSHHYSESALVEAAEEVGIDPASVLMATAEERLGLLGRSGSGDRTVLIDRLAGPAQLVAQNVVLGNATSVFDSLDTWLTRKAGVRRSEIDRAGCRATYRRRTDALAGAQRTVRTAVGRVHLGSIRSVELRVTQLDASRSLAALVADVSAERRSTAVTAAVVTASASAVSAAVALSGEVALWLGVPASCAVGLGVLSSRSWSSQRAAESLRDVLARGTGSKRG